MSEMVLMNRAEEGPMIHHQTIDGVSVITFEEDEQLHDAEPLRDFLRDLIQEGKVYILIDLAHVNYISSSVLGVFVTTYRELQKKDGALKLLNVQPSVSHLFSITRLDRVLELFNDQDTAIKSFQ